jgi:hypothetical protein
MPWSQDQEELKALEAQQIGAGAQLRKPNPVRDIEKLSEGIDVFLCTLSKDGKVTKKQAKISIGPYPDASPSFMDVKINGKQCQIPLRKYGIIASREHVFAKAHWIELVS